jgi:hypothetical protein
MSDDTSSYSDFVKKIIEKDRELRKRMEAAHGESEEIYKLYKERFDNYAAAEEMSNDLPIKILLSSLKSDIVLEVALFKTRKDFDEQVSQIITRLDNIENDITTIKDKLNINN